MEYYVYILKSIDRNYIYVGLTNNITRRVDEHQRGHQRTTRPYRPFHLIFTEKYSARVDARKREKYLKSGIGKEWIKENLMS